MKVGTLAYCTEQGLGYLAYEFWKNGVVTDPILLHHSHRPNRFQWYPGSTPILSTKERNFGEEYERLARGVDVMLFFETPFRWPVIPHLRKHGVKTVLMTMYECTPAQMPHQPDLVINPSALDHRYFPEGVRMTVPVDANTWRARGSEVRTFVHNAGHGGLRGRNGTEELVRAWPMVDKEAKLILRTQEALPSPQLRSLKACGNVDVKIGSVPRGQLYLEGECFVFPEKFNGLSLPLQEAYAAGMVVAATDRFPNSEWLPKEPLIPIKGVNPARIGPAYTEFEEAVVQPEDIATKLNSLLGTDPTPHSEAGREWGRVNDWKVLKPKYITLLEQLVKGG